MNNNRDATEYLLAFGANLPGPDGSPPEQAIEAAIRAVSERLGQPLTSSRLFRTPCFPAGSGPDYVNAAARGTTQLVPEQILTILHEIENDFGRARTRRWGQRTLDIDLLAYGNEIAPDPATFRRWLRLPIQDQVGTAPTELILPHPRIQDRGFVLVPLAEIAPDWRHPVLDRTVIELRDALPEAALSDIAPLPAT